MTVTISFSVLFFSFLHFSYGFLVLFLFFLVFGLNWYFFGAGLYKTGFCHGTAGVEFCSGVSFLYDTTLISHWVFCIFYLFWGRLWGP
jgi:hypothetical protein